MYSIHAKEMGQGHFVNYEGYREDLDKYFASLHNPIFKAEKPEQRLPDLIDQICALAEISDVSSLFTNFILDFSSESKENFVKKSISMMLEREKVCWWGDCWYKCTKWLLLCFCISIRN